MTLVLILPLDRRLLSYHGRIPPRNNSAISSGVRSLSGTCYHRRFLRLPFHLSPYERYEVMPGQPGYGRDAHRVAEAEQRLVASQAAEPVTPRAHQPGVLTRRHPADAHTSPADLDQSLLGRTSPRRAKAA